MDRLRVHGGHAGGLCAVSADACAKATTDIVLASLETIGTVVGTIVTGGAAGAVKAAASTAARIAAKGISAAVAKGAIAKAAAAAGKEYTQIQLENMAKASVGDDFDPAMLDPTGIASLVKAFDKPICNDPSATTKTSTTRPLLNLTALASASFDYIDWDGRRATVTLREPGRASIPRGFWVSAGGAAPREVASIRYTTPDGAKYTAWMTPTGFRHQPQTNVGQVDARTGQALGSHTDSFMHYRSWDGKGYSVNFGALIGKWQIQTL